MIQQQSSSQPQLVGNYVYTVCKQHHGSEWMLAAGKPRKWTTNESQALIFYSKLEAEECVKKCFTPSEIKSVYIGRLLVGA